MAGLAGNRLPSIVNTELLVIERRRARTGNSVRATPRFSIARFRVLGGRFLPRSSFPPINGRNTRQTLPTITVTVLSRARYSAGEEIHEGCPGEPEATSINRAAATFDGH